MHVRYKRGEITWAEYNAYLEARRRSHPIVEKLFPKLKRGEITWSEYYDRFARLHGYKNMREYRESFAQRNGYANMRDYENQRLYRLGLNLPSDKNKKCSLFLGVVVAEKLLSKIFHNVQRMPNCNPGYDFICAHGYKIDVKSSCLLTVNGYSHWTFHIGYNEGADYFLMIGFDRRTDLRPQHIWLIKGNEPIITRQKELHLNDRYRLTIPASSVGISRFLKYERIDKLVCAAEMCDVFMVNGENAHPTV